MVSAVPLNVSACLSKILLYYLQCVLMCHYNITHPFNPILIVFDIVNANVNVNSAIVLIGFLRCVCTFLLNLTGRPVSSLPYNVRKSDCYKFVYSVARSILYSHVYGLLQWLLMCPMCVYAHRV